MTELTRRESQVSEMLSLGLQNKEIALRLGISRRTVEEYRADVYKKFGVRNAVQLTRKMLGADDATTGAQ